MKRTLLIAFIFASFVSQAQPVQSLGNPKTQLQVRGPLQVDSNLILSGTRLRVSSGKLQSFDGELWKDIAGAPGNKWTRSALSITNTPSLQTAIDASATPQVWFEDGTTTTLTGTVDFKGKRLKMDPGSKIEGTVVLKNVLIEAPDGVAVLGTGVTVDSIQNEWVDIRWFGGTDDYKPSVTTGTDNYPAFLRAVNSFAPGKTVKIHFPSSNKQDYGYRFGTNPGTMTRRFWFFGDGDNSILYLNGTQLGIKPSGEGAKYSMISDLYIRGGTDLASAGFNSPTAHGVWIAAPYFTMKYVTIRGFDGNGVYLAGDVTVSPATNANQCFLDHISLIGNGANGFESKGGDGNAGITIGLNAVANALSGIKEGSLLGNHHNGVHVAANPSDHYLQKTFVQRNGIKYLAIYDTTAIQPGSHPEWQKYWEVTDITKSGPSPWPEWNVSTKYYAGAGIIVTDPNNLSSFPGWYAEIDQKLFINKGRATFPYAKGEGGNNGPGAYTYNNGAIESASWRAVNSGTGKFYEIGMDKGLAHFPNFSGDALERNLRFEATSKAWVFSKGNLDNTRGVYFTDDATLLTNGRAGWPTTTALASYSPIWMKDKDNDNLRSFGPASNVPTTGTHAAGDYYYNVGTNRAIVAWICTSAGTPGTWVAVNGSSPLNNTYTQSTSGVAALDANRGQDLNTRLVAVEGTFNELHPFDFYGAGTTASPTRVRNKMDSTIAYDSIAAHRARMIANESAIAGKAPLAHAHTGDSITSGNISVNVLAENIGEEAQVLTFEGGVAKWKDPGGGGALTDKDYGDVDVSGGGQVITIDTSVRSSFAPERFAVARMQRMGSTVVGQAAAFSSPSEANGTATTLTTGKWRLIAAIIPQAGPVNQVKYWITTAGVFSGSTENKVFLFRTTPAGDSAYKVAETTHSDALFNTTGLMTATFTSTYTIPEGQQGLFYVAMLVTGATTNPTITARTGVTNTALNRWDYSYNKSLSYEVSNTTVPASIAFTGYSANSNTTQPYVSLHYVAQ